MIKAVLFDLDGTLIDTNELILKTFKYTFKEIMDLDLEENEITANFGRPLEYVFGLYSEDMDKINEAVRSYREYNIKIHDEMCKPFKNVTILLEKLKEKGIKCGIVTSKRRAIAMRGMEIADIAKYMDVIITPECTKEHKPLGEPALKALEELSLDGSEALMVGDSPFDILCGRRAGCKTVAVKYTALDIKELENVNPDYFIENPLEILELL